jgi:thiosulfate reductase/polysulfide reductase chain A
MAPKTNSERGVTTKKAICWASPGCLSSCGILVNVKDGKIISMKGNPDFPGSWGAVCSKRFPHLIKWLYHPDQLMYPLKRKGERGENQWERISWDQALDEIADKLKQLKAQHGAETLSVIEGTYRTDLYGIRGRFLNLFGNPQNSASPGITCTCNKEAIDMMLAGSSLPSMIRSLSNKFSPECLVFCGTNLPESRVIAWRQIKKSLQQEQKPKIIVIDPRKTEIADNADLWLQIRPGTDTALFMAWLNVICEEELYDKQFIDKWTYGFEELKRRAADYPPEKVAEITWIPADKIRESARIYGKSKPAAIILGLAADHIGLNSIRVEQARICLHAVTGNMKPEYGETPTGPGPLIDGKMGIRDAMLQMEDKCTPEQRKKQLGADRFKLMTWPGYEIISKCYKKVYGIPLYMCGHAFSVPEPVIWRSILEKKPYPTTALLTWTSNPIINAANTKMVYKALKSPDLKLHVVLEHFMTPTALLADYVLPAASKLERGILSTTEDFTPVFKVGERSVPPLGERKHDYYFFREMAIRLGFGEFFPWKDEEELYDYRLSPLGITFKQAATEKFIVGSDKPWTYESINPATGKQTGFATPSGKFELYSNVLKELGYDPLPFYEEPAESPVRTPEVAREYPLILTTGGRFQPEFQSEHRQLGMGLREQHPEPLVEIHPDTARELGITEGDWAYIETLRGVIKQKAKITDRIHPKVINCEHCWWFPEQPAQEPWLHGLWQSNANVLTADDLDMCDPLTGGWPMRALQCKVYKVLEPQKDPVTKLK